MILTVWQVTCTGCRMNNQILALYQTSQLEFPLAPCIVQASPSLIFQLHAGHLWFGCHPQYLLSAQDSAACWSANTDYIDFSWHSNLRSCFLNPLYLNVGRTLTFQMWSLSLSLTLTRTRTHTRMHTHTMYLSLPACWGSHCHLRCFWQLLPFINN